MDFDVLKASMKKETAMQIYQDMETLFDTTVIELKKKMQFDKVNFETILYKF